jgi:hypothetical protein
MLTSTTYKACDTLFAELLQSLFETGTPIDYAAYTIAHVKYVDRLGALIRDMLENPAKDTSTSREGNRVRKILLANVDTVTANLKSTASLPAWTPSFKTVLNTIVCPLLAPIWAPVRSAKNANPLNLAGFALLANLQIHDSDVFFFSACRDP